MGRAEKKYQIWEPFMESACLAGDIVEVLEDVPDYARREVLEEFFDCSDWKIMHIESYKKMGLVRFTFPIYWMTLPILMLCRALKYFATGDSRFNQDAEVWKAIIKWEKELRRF